MSPLDVVESLDYLRSSIPMVLSPVSPIPTNIPMPCASPCSIPWKISSRYHLPWFRFSDCLCISALRPPKLGSSDRATARGSRRHVERCHQAARLCAAAQAIGDRRSGGARGVTWGLPVILHGPQAKPLEYPTPGAQEIGAMESPSVSF